MAAAGPAILFVVLLAALSMAGIVTLLIMSRCVLVVVQDTAAGHDEVTWPNEPYVDWLVHAVLFVELVGIWLAPAGMIARTLRNVWLPEEGALRVLLLAGPGLWLFFPIGLLSSLSASSRWVPFRWTIFCQFLRIAPAAVGFYFLTAILLIVATAAWYYALVKHHTLFLPVAAMVSAAVILIYARLLGRVAWLISRLPSPTRTPARPKAENRPLVKSDSRKPAKSSGKKKRKPAAEVQDPWADPEKEPPQAKKKNRFPWAEDPPPPPKKKAYTPPRPDEIEGYGIAAEEPARPDPPPEKRAKHSAYMSPEEYEPIEVQPTLDAETPRPNDEPDSWFAEQVRQRLAEREHPELPPPPHPFFSGVYTFPWYSHCISTWILLSLALLVVGGIISGLIHFGRAIFGW